MIAGNICWGYVYFEILRLCQRNKTCCIPPFALALNIAWEAIYVFEFGRHLQIESFIYGILLVFSILLAINYFKYEKYRFPAKIQNQFTIISAALFAAAFFIMLAFYFQFKTHPAFLYSISLRYSLVSILFLHMFYTTDGTHHQQIRIAIAKCIGTLVLSIQYGYIEMTNPFVLICAAVSFIADVWYTIALIISKKATMHSKNNN